MDSPSPSQGFARSACGPKKSPTRKSCHNYEYFTPLPINLWESKKCSYVTIKRNDDDEVELDFEDIDTTDDYEYFDGYEHDQEVQEQKVKIKKKWNGNMASFNEF